MNLPRVPATSAPDVRAVLFGLALAFVVGPVCALTPFSLVDTVWAWHPSGAGESQRAGVAPPERYTLQLLADGTLRVRADCNRGGGRYESNDVELKLGRIATTKKGCPADSRAGEFLDKLSKVREYRFEGTELVLTQAGGTAPMRLQPARR